jgi:glycosyltransferase involved in cell wall biosynthesis
MNGFDAGISFVIPAYNEQDFIGKTLQSIHQRVPEGIEYEVVVLDNGSTDNTFEIANSNDALVFKVENKTIAHLRNIGARETRYPVLIFIDADIVLTEQWKHEIKQTLETFDRTPLLVTGSRVLPEDEIKWLNKYWFHRLTQYDAPYINSGHLITSRKLFNKLGGFNSELKTAEDYDFCMRAKLAGSRLSNNRELAVIHLGYPKTIRKFFCRERWHGKQDFMSWNAFRTSKIAQIAAFNLIFFLVAVVMTLLSFDLIYVFTYLAGMTGVSMLLTLVKFGKLPAIPFINTSIIFYIYLWGRSWSMLDRLKMYWSSPTGHFL